MLHKSTKDGEGVVVAVFKKFEAKSMAHCENKAEDPWIQIIINHNNMSVKLNICTVYLTLYED